MAEQEKSEMQKLQESLFTKPKHAATTLDKKHVYAFGDDYKAFISSHKTEREVVEEIKAQAEKKGFVDLRSVTEVTAGGMYYLADGSKNIALIRFAGLSDLRVVASHVDSPCLHLKPKPLQESNKVAILKSHYYGGIKKYQWVNIPLALRGVAFTADGKKVSVRLGEDDTPSLMIPDLLPHLARDYLDKKAREVVTGEQLNPIVANVPVDDMKIKDPVALAAAKYLHDEYGLVVDDLVGAELSLVPAGAARDIGFDASMISGYGHDDRSCTYASLRAILDGDGSSRTQISAFYDKEEIGSQGKTGAQNMFMTRLIESLIELSETDLRPTQVWQNTKIISADVTACIDPTFSDVHDPSNSTYLGYGVAIEKYGGGGGGKYHTNDADAEFTSAVIRMFNKHGVVWQTGELGKLEIGGGGTIAMYLAQQGADVIDIGAAVLGMHAPYELISKYDLYSMYEAYKVFLEQEL